MGREELALEAERRLTSHRLHAVCLALFTTGVPHTLCTSCSLHGVPTVYLILFAHGTPYTVFHTHHIHHILDSLIYMP
jgi:hypothetical protein